MSKRTRARFSLLDGVLCAVTALAIVLSVGYFSAADGSAAADYAVAEDDAAVPSLIAAALTGTETELSAAQLNRLLREKIDLSSSAVQQLLVKPSGTENEIECCITVFTRGRSWVLSAAGTLLAEQENETVSAFVFSPQKLRIGKLPLSRSLFFSLLQPDRLPDGVSVADGTLRFSASLVPVPLSSFRVSESSFVFRPKAPLDRLIDRIDDFAQQSPEEQKKSGEALRQELTEQAKQALAEGKDAFERFKRKIKEQYASLDTERIFAEVEEELQSAAGKVEDFVRQNGDKLSDAVRNFFDALQSDRPSAE